MDLAITRDPSKNPKALAAAHANFEMLRAMQTGIGASVKVPTGMSEAQMQAVFDARWYDEVQDPTSGYSHLALQQVESWDDAADGTGGLVKRIETKAGKPPALSFGKLSADVRKLRDLARKGKAREDKLRMEMRGKEVEHWVQGELFADLAEEEEAVESRPE